MQDSFCDAVFIFKILACSESEIHVNKMEKPLSISILVLVYYTYCVKFWLRYDCFGIPRCDPGSPDPILAILSSTCIPP
jgi:hypothetical protein